MIRRSTFFALSLSWIVTPLFSVFAEEVALDERPAGPGEWGFRPLEGGLAERNPPSFCWRPQKGAATYELQIASDLGFESEVYAKRGIPFNVHCPSKSLDLGAYHWRYRSHGSDGRASSWSRTRHFEVGSDSVPFPIPEREEALSRVPLDHPRLFIRPEDLSRLRGLAKGELADAFSKLLKKCDKLVEDPPSTEEPPKYSEGMKRGSEEWRAVWWGNRKTTIRVLESAATLAFVHRLTGTKVYGELARDILLRVAEWDPKGATGYRYNDEAGMPYAYHFSRTYTFVHDLLSETERETCREVMRIRGREMYDHLHPRHLWKPYSSHSNRAWHFLGEVGIAFLHEIPEAADWIEFALNVFANVYPVWSDADGGWHEGMAYWRSYLSRFTWWADVMREAVGIDAYRLPFFAHAGDFALYVTPPGTGGGGFGDQSARIRSSDNAALVETFARASGNPYWQWYAESHPDRRRSSGYIDFVRASRQAPRAMSPRELPSSRLFRGTGLAALNTDLSSGKDNVQILFKSSPFGSQSHGYEAQNAFLLYAFGERLAIRSGKRDSYGSKHHREWMWETKSVNSVTIGGVGQHPHTSKVRGEIVDFRSSEVIDFVVGETMDAYPVPGDRFRREILFIKPSWILVLDHLEVDEPSTFEWRLHSPSPIRVVSSEAASLAVGEARCAVTFHHPVVSVEETDQFDPPPRPRVRLKESHLHAATTSPSREVTFLVSMQPHRSTQTRPSPPVVRQVEGGWVLQASTDFGPMDVLIKHPESERVAWEHTETTRTWTVQWKDRGVARRYESGTGDRHE